MADKNAGNEREGLWNGVELCNMLKLETFL